jgi:tetratricopeptide (TPR) repeat protein
MTPDVQALAAARQALAQAPDEPAPLFVLAALLLRQGDPAANELLPRLDGFRTYGAGWRQLGEALAAGGQWAGASVAYARAQAAEPNHAAGHFGQGRASRGLGKPVEAMAAFEQAVRLEPGFAPAWFALGLVRQDLKHPAAVAAYRSALAADPTLHEAALNLGIACQEAGDLEAAFDAYGQAFRTRPEALGRIGHALSSSRVGCLFLDPAALGDFLRARPLGAEALAVKAGA